MLRIIFWILIICICIEKAHCNDKHEQNQMISKLVVLTKIISNSERIVLDLKDNHLYLNPQKITPSEHGMVLNIGNFEEIILPDVHSDDKGCFILCTSEDLNKIAEQSDELRFWWCPACNTFRKMDRWGRCNVCGRKL